MNIRVKFLGIDMPNQQEAIDLILPEGATVNSLMQVCAADEQFNIEYENLKMATVMINKQLVAMHTMVHNGDEVLILRALAGG